MAPKVFILTAGVEPTTRCLEGSCSIQLSYASKSGANIAIYQTSFKTFPKKTFSVATALTFIYIYARIDIFA